MALAAHTILAALVYMSFEPTHLPGTYMEDGCLFLRWSHSDTELAQPVVRRLLFLIDQWQEANYC